MGLIRNRTGPLRRFLPRIAVFQFVRMTADRDDLNDEQRSGVRAILANRNGEFDSLVDLVNADMPAAGAIAADYEADAANGDRPFLRWLFSPDGQAWLYALLTVILMSLGIDLPPLPPLPPLS